MPATRVIVPIAGLLLAIGLGLLQPGVSRSQVCGDGTCDDRERETCTADCGPALPLRTFERAPFDYVLPEFTPQGGAPEPEFVMSLARDEYESIAIGLHASQAVTDLRAEVGPLIDSEQRAVDAEVDLRVVKVWPQAGLDHRISSPEGVMVPELLVYDDAQHLAADFQAIPPDVLVSGSSGKGLVLDGRTVLALPTTGMSTRRGTISFKFRPQWDSRSDAEIRYLFHLAVTPTDEMIIYYHGAQGRLHFVLEGSNRWLGKAVNVPFRMGTWQNIACAWDAPAAKRSTLRCSLNGRVVANVTGASPLSRLPDHFLLGSHTKGTAAGGTFDELRAYRYAASDAELASGNFDKSRRVLAEDFESLDGVRATAQRFELYQPVYPELRREFRTSIPAQSSKQLWLTMRTAPGTPSGSYKMELRLSSAEHRTLRIPLRVEVLPFDLAPASRDHGVYLDHTMQPGRYGSVTPDVFAAVLRDLTRHGVNSLLVRVDEQADLGSKAYLAQMYQMIAEAGIERVILVGPRSGEAIQHALGAGRQYGFEIYFYGLDEPNSEEKLRIHIPLSRSFHKAGGKVSTAIVKANQDRLSNPRDSAYDLAASKGGPTFRQQGITSEALDLPIYHASYLQYSDEYNPIRSHREVDEPLHRYCVNNFEGTGRKASTLEYFYWQSWVQKPNLNRLMAGYFLWACRLDGAFPYIYTKFRRKAGDPFDDRAGAYEHNYRQMMTAYPGRTGPIPTTQWEAFREGADDARYAGTLQGYLQQLPEDDPLRLSIETRFRDLLRKYLDPHNYRVLSPGTLDSDRQQIIAWIHQARASQRSRVSEPPVSIAIE